MARPRITPEQRREQDRRFWIVPGSFVGHRAYPGRVMSVRRVLAKRIQVTIGPCPECKAGKPCTNTPERTWCRKGMLMREANRTDGIEVQWLDDLGKLFEATFQVKELHPITDAHGTPLGREA